MSTIGVFLIFLTVASHGRGVNSAQSSEFHQKTDPQSASNSRFQGKPSDLEWREDAPNALKSLATLLMEFSPAAVGVKPVVSRRKESVLSQVALDCRRLARSAPVMKLGRGQQMTRRHFAGAASIAAATPLLAVDAVGPSSLSGKPRPEVGVILLDVPQSNGKLVSADIVCDGGVVASLAFETNLKLARGNYYDLEVNNEAKDTMYVQVAEMPKGESLASVPPEFFRGEIFSQTGRFSSYGAPNEISIKDKGMQGGTRLLDVKFEVLAATGGDNQRKGVIAVVQPPGSSDAVMLVGSTYGGKRWQEAQSDIRRSVESFQVTSTRQSKLTRAFTSDYRYAGGGIEDDSTGTRVDNTLASRRARASLAGGL